MVSGTGYGRFWGEVIAMTKTTTRTGAGRLSLLVLPFLAALLQANLGVVPITEEEFLAVPAWQPDEQGVGEMPRVDLRGDLPPVGQQGRQQSCVGWAVAYACKHASPAWM